MVVIAIAGRKLSLSMREKALKPIKQKAIEVYRRDCTITVAQVAKVVGVSSRTIFRWMRDDPEFKAAQVVARDEAFENWSKSLLARFR